MPVAREVALEQIARALAPAPRSTRVHADAVPPVERGGEPVAPLRRARRASSTPAATTADARDTASAADGANDDGQRLVERHVPEVLVHVLARVAVRRIAQDAARAHRARTERHRALEPADDLALREHARHAREQPRPVRLVDVVEPAVVERALDLVVRERRTKREPGSRPPDARRGERGAERAARRLGHRRKRRARRRRAARSSVLKRGLANIAPPNADAVEIRCRPTRSGGVARRRAPARQVKLAASARRACCSRDVQRLRRRRGAWLPAARPCRSDALQTRVVQVHAGAVRPVPSKDLPSSRSNSGSAPMLSRSSAANGSCELDAERRARARAPRAASRSPPATGPRGARSAPSVANERQRAGGSRAADEHGVGRIRGRRPRGPRRPATASIGRTGDVAERWSRDRRDPRRARCRRPRRPTSSSMIAGLEARRRADTPRPPRAGNPPVCA